MARKRDSKIAVVTGGSRGIGKSIASALAKAGAQTVIVASSHANLDRARSQIVEEGGKEPLALQADLRTAEGCQVVHEAVVRRYGRCHILVNCAGATKAGSFLERSDEDWFDGFALKFFGAVRLCRMLWPLLREAQGHVVNIVGNGARNPDADVLIGGSVNAALANFTKGLSRLGMRDGVNVNAIHPGRIETDRVGILLRQRATARGITINQLLEEEQLEGKQTGKPEDVAELVLFLCSESARHIRGVAIAVDGGSSRGVC